MNEFRQMTNDAIKIGIASDVSVLKRLSKLCYKELNGFRKVPTYYKLCAISKASGIISARNKSLKRNRVTKDPYVTKPCLVSCYGFKIINGKLRISLSKRMFEFIPLNKRTLKVLEDKSLSVRSFTLTQTSLSLCIVKEVPEIQAITSAIGVDRNLRNLTVGNKSKVTYYDLRKVVEIGETTRDIIASFKRNDHRIRKALASRYGKRKKERVKNLVNKISKDVVSTRVENKEAVIFENITHIRSMYQKGNGQGNDKRRQLNNNWPFAEIKRQIEYKAVWAGIPVVHLTKSETRGTSSNCYICGERLQSSREKKRQLWCKKCERWFDRDLVAVMNISSKGWVRFAHSQGIGSEAMKGNPTTTVILRVDPMKL